MIADQRWRSLGWRHILWDLVRYYLSLRSPARRIEWTQELLNSSSLDVDGDTRFPIDPSDVQLFFDYLAYRDEDYARAAALLRTEEEAIQFCRDEGFILGKTATKSIDHHQSSNALVTAVSGIANRVCLKLGKNVVSSPQTRCIWCVENGLHVTARNLDGAIPSLANPWLIWEIKEYWGKTSGGSKMSDAVYECNLVGRELRDFEEVVDLPHRVQHIVFVDGKTQWNSRVSDLKRFIDLFNQGLIDHLFIGKDVESSWENALMELVVM